MGLIRKTEVHVIHESDRMLFVDIDVENQRLKGVNYMQGTSESERELFYTTFNKIDEELTTFVKRYIGRSVNLPEIGEIDNAIWVGIAMQHALGEASVSNVVIEKHGLTLKQVELIVCADKLTTDEINDTEYFIERIETHAEDFRNH